MKLVATLTFTTDQVLEAVKAMVEREGWIVEGEPEASDKVQVTVKVTNERKKSGIGIFPPKKEFS